MSQLTIVLIILLAAIIAFMSGKLPYTVISMGTIIALIGTEVMTVEQAFSALTNKNVIMLAAMFVIGAGITKSGLLEGTKTIVMRFEKQPKMVVLVLMLVTIFLSVLSSAVGTLAILLPLLISVANSIDISRSKLIFPVAAVANIATACTFLGQGAANMNWSDVMMNMGAPVPFTIWDFTIARIPTIVIAVLYGLFIAPRLLPDIPNSSFETKETEQTTQKKVPLSKPKQKLAQVICGASVVAMIALDYFQIVPMYLTACFGAVLLILFGILTEMEALSAIHGPTMFLFIGMLPLSDALKMTGAADVVADGMLHMIGGTQNPYIIMAVFFLAPLILTQVMSNIAAVAVFVPLVSSVALSIGVDPRAAVMGVIIASCTSILTPMAASAQTMIMVPGGYNIKDYLRCGTPLAVMIAAVSILLLPMMYPF